MTVRMLIIDDEMQLDKGYGMIQEWFPEAFEIDVARSFIPCKRFKNPATCASTLLASRVYEVVLLDFNFELDDLNGIIAVAAIRRGRSDRCPGISWDTNRNVHIIGVSDGWDGAGGRSLQRFLKTKGVDRGLDGSACLEGMMVQQLREELAKFLASR